MLYLSKPLFTIKMGEQGHQFFSVSLEEKDWQEAQCFGDFIKQERGA
jgi:hypothetical protein